MQRQPSAIAAKPRMEENKDSMDDFDIGDLDSLVLSDLEDDHQANKQ